MAVSLAGLGETFTSSLSVLAFPLGLCLYLTKMTDKFFRDLGGLPALV